MGVRVKSVDMSDGLPRKGKLAISRGDTRGKGRSDWGVGGSVEERGLGPDRQW